jgi:hypothetical protein
MLLGTLTRARATAGYCIARYRHHVYSHYKRRPRGPPAAGINWCVTFPTVPLPASNGSPRLGRRVTALAVSSHSLRASAKTHRHFGSSVRTRRCRYAFLTPLFGGIGVLGRVRLSVCSFPERRSARSRFPCYSGLAAHRSVSSRPAAHGALDPILDACVATYNEEQGSGLPGSWAVLFAQRYDPPIRRFYQRQFRCGARSSAVSQPKGNAGLVLLRSILRIVSRRSASNRSTARLCPMLPSRTF